MMNNYSKWTLDEVGKLIKLYSVKTLIELSLVFKRKTGVIHAKAKSFGLSKIIKRDKWSKEEDLILKNNLGILSDKELSKILGRSCESVRNRRYNLKKDKPQINNKKTKIYPTEKICRICFSNKPITDFSPKESRCKTCNSERSKVYRLNNRESLLKNKYENHIKNFENYMFQNCKYRANKFGLDFNISIEDIIIPDFCPVLNIPLYPGNYINKNNTPSIDRINSNLGYTKDNIVIVSWRANNLKYNASLEELRLLVDFYNKIDIYEPELYYTYDKKLARSLLKSVRSRSVRKKILFDLKIEDIIIPEFCPIFKIKLIKNNSSLSSNSPSIDRINPELGYIKSNICVVSNRVNLIKKDATLEELKQIVKFYSGLRDLTNVSKDTIIMLV